MSDRDISAGEIAFLSSVILSRSPNNSQFDQDRIALMASILVIERDTLRAQLTQARSDALEEAAKVVEEERNRRGCTKATDGLWTARGLIRALKETTP